MAKPLQYGEFEKGRLMLGLLESVERDAGQTQRRLASDLGIALGLVNAYMRACINKGLIKVREVPTRRYAYYLTPQGFAEKSRLTVEFLSHSFSLLRRARADYTDLMQTARAQGFHRVVLAGASELAEIAMICALEAEVDVVAIVDRQYAQPRFLGRTVAATFVAVPVPFDAIVVTDLRGADSYAAALHHCGEDRVLRPALLGLASEMHARAAE